MEDSGSSLGRYLLFAVLAGVAAFFSLAEVALPRASRQRLRQLSEQGHLPAAVALRLVEAPSRLVSTLRVGHALSSVGAAVVLASDLAARFGSAGAWLAFAVAGTVFLLAVEALPRAAAARSPDRVALWCALPARLFTWLLAPVVTLVALLARAAGWVLRVHVPGEAPLAEGELDLVARMEEANGELEAGEREMIHSIFEFRETVVREIMVPRVDVVAVRHDAPLGEIVDLVLEEGHSRIPVYRETIDHIVGVVYVKDLFRYLRDGHTQITAAEVMRPAYYVPETKKVDELFQEMRQKKVHLAIVVDEYGGTAGLVTIEDVLEEIVGEIRDEYDVAEDPAVEQVGPDEYLFDARVDLDDVNDLLGTQLPKELGETLGGFIYGQLGKVPAAGERLSFNNALEMEVLEVSGRRIRKVRLRRLVTEP
ncbi:MAG: hemolysin family protein, partial [Firmicutes bacterium]|nr:hemolysin family protein [Bacillota bacterium]